MQITASNWQLLSPLVDEALALAPEARSAWLDAQTQLSEPVHAQLAELIAVADAPETNALFRILPNLATAPQSTDFNRSARAPGNTIGAYTLLRPLGRGGMAEVWLARRNDGAYERDIALKLPLAHLPANHAAERLMRERNVLATLEHPAIARLYDAGIAADGQPFLAMEYVEGENIIDYANHAKLDLRDRCKLMLQVLGALHYAHQHLVVHRDLKPSNILVRADGRVTLLDFGIAKVMGESDGLAHETELTRSVGNALTIAYAAPEQLLGESVTTATDLFSAGVVLFELLTHQRPFKNAEKSAMGLVLAMETSTPSMRIVDASEADALAHGFATMNAWQRAYSGDLAAICARALRREPSARYASAMTFRDDLTRHFDHQPVLAREGAWAYRSRKFFYRNRFTLVTAAIAGAASLGIGVQAWVKTRDLQISDARVSAVESVVKRLFKGMSPDNNAPKVFTAKSLLDQSRPVLLQAAAQSPKTRSETTLMMANLYLEIAAYDDAISLLNDEVVDARANRDLRREAWAKCLIADAYLDTERAKPASEMLLKMRDQLRDVAGEPDSLLAQIDYRLGAAAVLQENFGEGSKRLQAARKALATLNDRPTDLLVRILDMQGSLARRQGDLKAALAAFTEAKKNLPAGQDGQLSRYAVTINLISVELAAGRYTDVIRDARSLQTELEGRLAEGNQWSMGAATYLTEAFIRTGQFDAATQQIEALKAHTDKKSDQYLYRVKTPFAQIALFKGNAVQAAAEFSAILAESEARPASLNREVTRRYLALALLQLGRTDEAINLLKVAETNFLVLTSSAKHPHVALTRILLGCAYLRMEDWRNAEANLRPAHTDLLAARQADHYGTQLGAAYLAFLPANRGLPTNELATHIAKELGWQYGAAELVSRLRSPDQRGFRTLPALL